MNGLSMLENLLNFYRLFEMFLFSRFDCEFVILMSIRTNVEF